MSVFHYNNTPLPVGQQVGMNGSKNSYLLGLFDGATHCEQYADDPEAGVLFESPEAAARWLGATTAVLTPYIATGDKSKRIPNADGWEI